MSSRIRACLASHSLAHGLLCVFSFPLSSCPGRLCLCLCLALPCLAFARLPCLLHTKSQTLSLAIVHALEASSFFSCATYITRWAQAHPSYTHGRRPKGGPHSKETCAAPCQLPPVRSPCPSGALALARSHTPRPACAFPGGVQVRCCHASPHVACQGVRRSRDLCGA